MNTTHHFTFAELLVRLLLAMASGAAIGYGRARKKQNAGFRTYILVSLGAALTMLISFYEYEMLVGPWLGASDYTELRFDASRFAAQVVNGIGFLAAGTIIAIAHRQVSGLTTAIGLFAAACLGIAAGAGFYICVIPAVLLVILTMDVMKPLEVAYKRRLRNITISVEYRSSADLDTVTRIILDQDAQIFDIDVERTEQEGIPSAIFTIKLGKKNASHSALLSSVAELPCVHSIQELIS